MKIKSREALVRLIRSGDCERISIAGDGSWSGDLLTVGAGDVLARMGRKTARVAVVSCRQFGRDPSVVRVEAGLDAIEEGRKAEVAEDPVERLAALRDGVKWWLCAYLGIGGEVREMVDKACARLSEAVGWLDDEEVEKGVSSDGP